MVTLPPLLKTTLPKFAELPVKLVSETERMPWLLNTPPSLLLFAPAIVTPEMVKSPPVSMLKIL